MSSYRQSSGTSSEAQWPSADGASEAPTTAKKGGKAKPAAQNGVDESPAYDGECWAFSSRYIKTTQAALQTALNAVEVC